MAEEKKYTNMSRRVIHVGDVMLVPGVPGTIPEAFLDNHVIRDYMDSGDIREGEIQVQPEVDHGEDAPRMREATTTSRPAVAAPKVADKAK